MKKALIVLFVLAIVAGGVFAQAITFSGDIRGGLGVLITDRDDDDPILANNGGEFDFSQRFELTARWQNEEGTAGVRTVLRNRAQWAQRNMENANGTYLNIYEAWFKAMDGMFTFTFGKADLPGFWGAGGLDASWDIGAASAGLIVDIAPIPDLAFRVSIFPNTGINSNDPGTALKDGRYHFGFSYTMVDLVNIRGQLRQGNTNANGGFERIGDKTDFQIGFNILALKPMGLNDLALDFAIYNLQRPDANKDMALQIGERINYVMGDLGAGIRFRQDFIIFDGSSPDEYGADLTFTGYLQFAIGDIVPRLDVGFNKGTGIRAGCYETNASDYRRAWDGLNKADFYDGRGYWKDGMNLSIAPSVQFRYGTNRYIELGYHFMKDLSKDAEASATERTMNNLVYLDYRIAF